MSRGGERKKPFFVLEDGINSANSNNDVVEYFMRVPIKCRPVSIDIMWASSNFLDKAIILTIYRYRPSTDTITSSSNTMFAVPVTDYVNDEKDGEGSLFSNLKFRWELTEGTNFDFNEGDFFQFRWDGSTVGMPGTGSIRWYASFQPI